MKSENETKGRSQESGVEDITLSEDLTNDEIAILAVLEGFIERKWHVLEVLDDIRTNRLYRHDYNTFNEYVAGRWPALAKRRANTPISLAEFFAMGEPKKRPPKGLDKDVQKKASEESVQDAGSKSPSDAQMRKVARRHRAKPDTPSVHVDVSKRATADSDIERAETAAAAARPPSVFYPIHRVDTGYLRMICLCPERVKSQDPSFITSEELMKLAEGTPMTC